MYRIKEFQPNSSRATRLKHDMEAMQNVLTNIDPALSKSSIREFHRLDTSNPKPRPILIKFLHTFDATFVLSKRSSVPKQILVKPVMTREERAIKAVYLRTRWQLARNGTDKKLSSKEETTFMAIRVSFAQLRSNSTESYVMTPVTTNDG